MVNGTSKRKSYQKRKPAERKKGASKRRYAWVVGTSLDRIRITKELASGQYAVEFCEPSVDQEQSRCDRCHGFRHKKTNALCSAASGQASSPFTNDTSLYCIETGRNVGKIYFKEKTLGKGARIGSGVATVTLY